MTEQRYTDEELTAFLDGEMDAPDARILRDAAVSDALLRTRLDALDIDKVSVRSGFDEMLEFAPALPAEFREIATSAVRHLLPLAATLVIGAMVGFGGGALSTSDKGRSGWTDYVAAYHLLYTTATLETVSQAPEAAAAEIERVNLASGSPVPASVLIDFDGMNYKRAQILGFEGTPIAQYTFMNTDGVPFAFCVIRKTDASDSIMKTMRLENMASATWSDDDFEFLLIGGTDQQLVKGFAEQIRSNI